jgi:hypothetical protein
MTVIKTARSTAFEKTTENDGGAQISSDEQQPWSLKL